jgi:hypothetical protein
MEGLVEQVVFKIADVTSIQMNSTDLFEDVLKPNPGRLAEFIRKPGSYYS